MFDRSTSVGAFVALPLGNYVPKGSRGSKAKPESRKDLVERGEAVLDVARAFATAA